MYDSHQIWDRSQRGPQMFGSCSLVSDAGEGEARRLYAHRFPRLPRQAAPHAGTRREDDDAEQEGLNWNDFGRTSQG